MLDAYRSHVAERASLGLPPLPLDASQVSGLCQLLKGQDAGSQELIRMLAERVPPGVDEAARVKAVFLERVASSAVEVAGLSPAVACELLGPMMGGFNVEALVRLLSVPAIASTAADVLARTTLVFDNFHAVADLARQGHQPALDVLRRWADAEWFETRPPVPDAIELVVFKVPGEVTTDDLSPATDVSTRPDIPLHALAMFKNPRPGVVPDEPGKTGPLAQMAQLGRTGRPIVLVGDVVGTGSSRKSAVNSLMWHTGVDLPQVPNKRTGGVCLAARFAPIFYNTYEDAGGLPLELDVSGLSTGDLVTVRPHDAILITGSGERPLRSKGPVLMDEVRAGGRIPLIIGRALTAKARDFFGEAASTRFALPRPLQPSTRGFTRAQKLVGRACGLPDGQGIRPGTYCEPRIHSIGSPDTTGPLTRSELKDLACLGFSADLVLQSFCHTVAYPNAADIRVQRELPGFMSMRGGVVLRPGDGVIHSWLNRLLLPDQVGTGGDSHTRFPIGLSLPAGSGLVAFAAATGVMPLDMPESVRVRFHGRRRPGVTVRDLVHAIPLFARRAGLLTLDKQNKVNAFSGRILEIDGLADLSVDEAFELTDASAERSAAGATIALGVPAVVAHLQAGIEVIDALLAAGYEDADALRRRQAAMQQWLANPYLVEADADADHAAVLEIDLAEIGEPILCCPNDPDDARFLSELGEETIDEVFIGSCMTNASHFRKARALLDSDGRTPARLWIAPPTRMDEAALTADGSYGVFGLAGARTEMPGCSLCMGNQARVDDGASVVSTSTRNFPNRMGKNARVYLASAEVAALSARLGRLPSVPEYRDAVLAIA